MRWGNDPVYPGYLFVIVSDWPDMKNKILHVGTGKQRWRWMYSPMGYPLYWTGSGFTNELHKAHVFKKLSVMQRAFRWLPKGDIDVGLCVMPYREAMLMEMEKRIAG